MTFVAALIFIYWLIAGLDLVIGSAFFIPVLRENPKPLTAPGPKVSVIFAYRNEKDFTQALRSKLDQDYPDYEVIAVNDRSEYDILENFEPHERLKVVKVSAVPPGWLGKSNALYRGTLASSGDWVIFTDADVHFGRATLKEAVRAADRYKADHLVLFPRIILWNWLEAAFFSAFSMMFTLRFRPWAARLRRSRAFIGIGAFNMVRRRVYDAIGTHRAFPIEIADDMIIGKFVKAHGYKNFAAFGQKLIKVRWVEGWRDILFSLKKNAFTGVHSNILYLVAVTAAVFALHVAPFFLVFFLDSPGDYLLYACILIIALLQLGRAALDDRVFWGFVCYPAGALLVLGVMWNSALRRHHVR